MKWITHIALGFFAVKVMEIALMIDLLDDYLAYTVVSAFAVLPDIDFLIEIKHRGITHTIWFTLTALPLALIVDWKIAFVAWIAIFSHLVGDMMTYSGVKLLYPYRETVFYLTPPNWRIRTGSSAEFMILGILIIASILMESVVSTQTGVEKVFLLSKDHVVDAKILTFENGALYHYTVKIVWTDGKSKLGFLDREGRLRVIKKGDILDLEILRAEKVDKTARRDRVRIKDLPLWRHRIIVAWEDNGTWSKDFVGTGIDLYFKLEGLREDKYIGVEYYEVGRFCPSNHSAS